MEEKKKFFSKIGNFLKKHPWGCLAWSLFILTLCSLFCLFFFREALYLDLSDGQDFQSHLEGRSLGTRSFAYFVVCFAAFLLLWVNSLFQKLYNKERLFFFILCEILTLAEIWCWFFNITFLVPLGIILIILLCRKHISLAQDLENYYISLSAVLIIFCGGLATASATFEYYDHQEYQNNIQKALQSSTIELIDIKDRYIFTQEFGLEKTSDDTPITSLKKGDKVHRLPMRGDVVFVVK